MTEIHILRPAEAPGCWEDSAHYTQFFVVWEDGAHICLPQQLQILIAQVITDGGTSSPAFYATSGNKVACSG